MELHKDDVRGLSPISASVMNDEDSRQPVHQRSVGLTIRVRKIDYMLADIQAHIQVLRREKTHLGLVREELAGGVEAKRSGSSRSKTLLSK